MNNYLDTVDAVKQYVNIVKNDRFTQGQISSDWKNFLVDKKVIQSADEAQLPSKLIVNAYQAMSSSAVLDNLNLTFNADAGKINIGQGSIDAYTHSTLVQKVEDTISLTLRTLIPQAIYSLLKVDENTYQNSDAVVQMLLNQAPYNLIKQLEQAVLVGGLTTDGGSEFSAVYPIATDDLTNQSWKEDDLSIENLQNAINSVSGNWDEKRVFVNHQSITKLMNADQNAYKYLSDPVILGAILVPTDAISPHGRVIAIVLNVNNYFLGLGSDIINTFDSFDITDNSHYIESTLMVEGSLTAGNSAATIKRDITGFDQDAYDNAQNNLKGTLGTAKFYAVPVTSSADDAAILHVSGGETPDTADYTVSPFYDVVKNGESIAIQFEDKLTVKDAKYLFAGLSGLGYQGANISLVNPENLDTSSATDFSHMFDNFGTVTPFTMMASMNMSNAVNISQMFANNPSLSDDTYGLNSFDLPKVTNADNFVDGSTITNAINLMSLPITNNNLLNAFNTNLGTLTIPDSITMSNLIRMPGLTDELKNSNIKITFNASRYLIGDSFGTYLPSTVNGSVITSVLDKRVDSDMKIEKSFSLTSTAPATSAAPASSAAPTTPADPAK
jgi:hypothetical protein